MRMPKPSLFWIVSLVSPVVIGFIFHVIMNKVYDNDVLPSVYNKVNLKVIDNEIIFNDSIVLYKFIPIIGGDFTYIYKYAKDGTPRFNSTVMTSMLMGDIEVPANLYLLVMQPENMIKEYNRRFEEVNQQFIKLKLPLSLRYEDVVREDDKPIRTTLYRWLAFIHRLSKITDRQFVIPDYDYWYYAAQGGSNSKGFMYAGSDSLDKVGWYSGNILELKSEFKSGACDSIGDIVIFNGNVRSKAPNEMGLYGMSGGVREWVFNSRRPRELHNDDIYKVGEYIDALGGSYDDYREDCRVDIIKQYQWYSDPNELNGLRLMLEY